MRNRGLECLALLLFRHRRPFGWLAMAAVFLFLLSVETSLKGQDQTAKKAPSSRGWTLREAMAQLRQYPQDPYLQYVALQLARRKGRFDKTVEEIEGLLGRGSDESDNGRNQVDLFSVFTGALAVQESLQLETMRRQQPRPPQAGQMETKTIIRKVPYTVCRMVEETKTSADGTTYTVTKPVYETCYKELAESVAVSAPPAAAEESVSDNEPPRGEPVPPPASAEESTPGAGSPRALPAPWPAPAGAIAEQLVSPEGDAAEPKLEAKDRSREIVQIASLTGPEVKSHPWEKMLAGRKPELSPLAQCVPDDCYFGLFRSPSKLLEATRESDVWGAKLFQQTGRTARIQSIAERLKRQLAVEDSSGLRAFYDLTVGEMAVVGSDLFVAEGSDVTLLFRLKQPAAFQFIMDGLLAKAETARPDARRATGNYLGVPYVQLTTPDREVSVYAANPRPDLHVRSNSRVAFQRAIAAIQGGDAAGKAVCRLGETEEFAYIRTLLPRGAAEEDGLVYLSDPFIRRMVGPQLKLIERRRMLCYNHLRMIGHAALMYRTERGRAPKSLEELARARCCPGSFNQGTLACPDGGRYFLSADGTTGACTCHGDVHCLTPCCEILLTEVTGDEAAAYEAFRKDYDQYWKSYFDPIALRFQMTPRRYRLETLVLPLIDNSIYTALSKSLGGRPEALDGLPVPKRNIFSLELKFDKDVILKQMGLSTPKDERDLLKGLGITHAEKLDVQGFLVRGIEPRIGLHAYDFDPTFYLSLPGLFGGLSGGGGDLDPELGLLAGALNSPGYFSFPVKDAGVVDAFLHRLDRVLAIVARRPILNMVNAEFYRTSGQRAKNIRTFAVAFGPLKFRFYWARIGKGLYVATKPFIVDDLHQASGEKPMSADPGPVGHAMFRVRAQNWDCVLADYRLAWAENSRAACLANLRPLSNVARALIVPVSAEGGLEKLTWNTHQEAARLYGAPFVCPDGGRYVFSANGRACTCSIHGTTKAPRQPRIAAGNTGLDEMLQTFRGMTATLTFLKEGLRAVVIVERQ